VPYSNTIQNIVAALRSDASNPRITPESRVRIEAELDTLGDFPGMIGEALTKFRQAVALLKMKHDYGDEDAILLTSAHVHEVWDVLAPALERLAAGVPPQSAE
jgi:hypothetical protein